MTVALKPTGYWSKREVTSFFLQYKQYNRLTSPASIKPIYTPKGDQDGSMV